MPSRLGWIGTGRMGSAMVRRLLGAGHDVTVWNRTSAKTAPLQQAGANVALDKRDLVDQSAIFTMLSATADLEEVLFGPSGVVTGAARPRLIIDASSISRDGSAAIRHRLDELGVGYLSAPVSGNARVCAAGRLLIVVSGPRSLFEEAKPWFDAIAPHARWIGDGEAARVWKTAHNMFLGVTIQALCEITVLAEKYGIPRHVFLDAMNASVMGSTFSRYKTPALVNLEFDKVTFTPALLLKDLDLGIAAAHGHGVPVPCASTVRESIAALLGRGYGDVDFAVLLREVASNAGLEAVAEGVTVDDGLKR